MWDVLIPPCSWEPSSCKRRCSDPPYLQFIAKRKLQRTVLTWSGCKLSSLCEGGGMLIIFTCSRELRWKTQVNLSGESLLTKKLHGLLTWYHYVPPMSMGPLSLPFHPNIDSDYQHHSLYQQQSNKANQ